MQNRQRLSFQLLFVPGMALGSLTMPAVAQQASGLDEVVVTATKRETNLQDTPIAISVVGAEAIADKHIQSLLNLGDGGIPSLRIATFEARQSALTVGMRGIVPFDQNQTARDAGVGVYVDGVYLARSQGLNAALMDVERIEVLRGPQGTLFGRNTEGGAVSIVTKAPTGEFGGRANASVGNIGNNDAQLHLDLPAIANIAFKIDAASQQQDATVSNPAPGQYGWGYYNRVGGRFSALWQPSDGFSALLAYDKGKDENTPFYSQLINYNPNGRTVVAPGATICSTCIAPLAPLVEVHAERVDAAAIGVPQQLSVDDTQGVHATLKYAVSPTVELRSISAYRTVDTEQWDNSGGAQRTPAFTPNGLFSRYSLSDLSQHQVSQEFQLVGSARQIDYVVGAYYFKESAREYAATPSTNRWNATGTGYTFNSADVTGPITSANQGWVKEDWFLQRRSWADTESYAGFGQATWNATNVFHVTVGARYTQDKRDFFTDVVNGVRVAERNIKLDKGHVDPMVTLAWDALDDINLYAKFSTGYRAGGVNSRASGTLPAFGPEKVKAYEVGAKMDLLDRRLRLNLAGFKMDRDGTQVDFDYVDNTASVGLHTQETLNAPGRSHLNGGELELTAYLVEGLTVGASYAYTDAKIPATRNPLHYTNNGQPVSPTNPDLFGTLTPVFVVFTPKNAASAFVDYELPVGTADAKLRLHFDGNYADKMHSFQDENVLTDSSFIVNGNIALAGIALGGSDQKLTLSLWSRNLLDEEHIYRRSNANNNTLGSYANFNAPRTFGVEGRVSF